MVPKVPVLEGVPNERSSLGESRLSGPRSWECSVRRDLIFTSLGRAALRAIARLRRCARAGSLRTFRTNRRTRRSLRPFSRLRETAQRHRATSPPSTLFWSWLRSLNSPSCREGSYHQSFGGPCVDGAICERAASNLTLAPRNHGFVHRIRADRCPRQCRLSARCRTSHLVSRWSWPRGIDDR